MASADEDDGPASPVRPPSSRPRRSTAEVRILLLNSARELFARRGYAGTTTRAIAESAGVTEHLLFRHFGSKAQLFEHAVSEPLAAQLSEYEAVWRVHEPGISGIEGRSRMYVSSLYDHLRANRDLFRAFVLSAREDDLSGLLHEGSSPIARYLDRVAARTNHSLSSVGLDVPDTSVTVRVTFGHVFTLAIFDDLLFPAGSVPSRGVLIDEMTAYLLRGIDRHAGGPAGDGVVASDPAVRPGPPGLGRP